MIWLYILLGVLIIGLIALSLWLVAIKFKEKDKGNNEPLVFNLTGQGGAMLTEKRIVNGAGKRLVINALRNDIDQNSKEEKKEDIIIIPENNVLSLPQGTSSEKRNIKIYLPFEAEDIPSAIKDTPFGTAMRSLANNKEIERLKENILREGSDRKSAILKEIGDGEISEFYVQQLKDFVKKDLKDISSRKDNSSNIVDINRGGN